MKNSKRRKLHSLAFWEALRARYPIGSRWELVRPVGAVVAANFLTARALLRGEMKPWELVLLVALEALALSAISWVQTLSVPKEARADADEPKQPLGQRLFGLVFGLFWIVVVYSLIFNFYLREVPDWRALLAAPFAYLSGSAIRWPLAVSVAGALADAVADRQFWKHRGGIFVSTPGFTGLARWLTLIFGGIPFFVPFAVGAGAIAAVAKAIERRFLASPKNAWPLYVLPVLAIALFWGMGWLIRARVVGWTIGYITAKAGSELLLLGVPLLAEKAGNDWRLALEAPGSSAPAVKVTARKKRRG